MPSGPDGEITLLHNPRCSKSRAARDLLAERGVRFRERRYLEEPLTRAELEALAKRLAQPARSWVRRGESAFSECGLSDQASDADILDAITSHPILMERPIAIRGERAVVGRPPERVLELLP
jgi:arsenate reductase